MSDQSPQQHGDKPRAPRDQPDREAVRKRVRIKRIVTGAVAGVISVVTLAVGLRKRR
jgi:hypothetical protein